MSKVQRCAACRQEKPISEMKVCMHNQMHRYVCDMKCMNAFYNPPKKAAPEAEPVAWSYREYVWVTGLGGSVWREKLEAERPCTDDPNIKDLAPLYTAPQHDAELVELLRELRGSADCENVHHRPHEYHDASEPCKVLARIDAKLATLKVKP